MQHRGTVAFFTVRRGHYLQQGDGDELDLAAQTLLATAARGYDLEIRHGGSFKTPPHLRNDAHQVFIAQSRPAPKKPASGISRYIPKFHVGVRGRL